MSCQKEVELYVWLSGWEQLIDFDSPWFWCCICNLKSNSTETKLNDNVISLSVKLNRNKCQDTCVYKPVCVLGDKRFYVGGVDISFVKGDDVNACAALIVMSYPELEVSLVVV